MLFEFEQWVFKRGQKIISNRHFQGEGIGSISELHLTQTSRRGEGSVKILTFFLPKTYCRATIQ